MFRHIYYILARMSLSSEPLTLHSIVSALMRLTSVACGCSGTFANPGSWFDPASADHQEPSPPNTPHSRKGSTPEGSWEDLLGEDTRGSRTSTGAAEQLSGSGMPRKEARREEMDREDMLWDAMSQVEDPGSDGEDEYDGGSLTREVSSLMKPRLGPCLCS